MRVPPILRPTRATAVLPAAAVLAGLLATTSGAAAKLVTPDGYTTAAAAGSDPAEDFTACMRGNGVPDFPSVTISPDGRVNLDLRGTGINVFSPEYRSAARTCAGMLPTGATLPGEPDPPRPPQPPTRPTVSGSEYPGSCLPAPPSPQPPQPPEPPR